MALNNSDFFLKIINKFSYLINLLNYWVINEYIVTYNIKYLGDVNLVS